MAMNVGQSEGEDTPMSDINTTPLVDVMLVLLIIFLITVPVAIQTIPVELPTVEYEPTTTGPNNVNLSVTKSETGECQVYWEQTPVTSADLFGRAEKALKDEVERLGGPDQIDPDEVPEAHVRGDINTPYRCIGGTIFTMQRAGFTRIAFISEPAPRGGPQ